MMNSWIILRASDGSTEYLNMNNANRIIHRTDEYVIEFNNGRVVVRRDQNPATYAHISAFLGDPAMH